MAEQEHIPATMPALHLPPGPYDSSSPPPPSSLLYTPNRPTPTPTPTQYLLKILTSSLCRGELSWPETLLPSRQSAPPIPGHDVCGIVLATPAVDERSLTGPKFKVGDEVVGLLAFARDGGCADVAVAEEAELAFKPRNVRAVEAAAVPLSALTGWQALFGRDATGTWMGTGAGVGIGGFKGAGLKGVVEYSSAEDEGEEARREREVADDRVKRVLVLNASGGVGVMFLQLLRAKMLFGDDARGRFWICGTCSGRNAEFVRGELGADEVLDYTSVKKGEGGGLGGAFRERGWDPVDFVLDCVGGETLRQAHDPSIVRDGGIVLSIVEPVPESEAWADVRAGIVKRGLTSQFFIVEPNGEQLEKISVLVDRGQLRAFVEQEMGLEEGREAMELVESGRVRGKIVLRVNYDGQ
ncbi:hypothetical protein FQN50_003983 [Emmonsiellopsis sp. PD_5]|nr:hypothetical protein FQN50_003983 [Emmonsiellopsis sp. PD_5]